MWLQNIATHLVDSGYNVTYVTLEMAKHKCTKRMGAMRLKIPIDEYDELSKDSMFMKQKINEVKNLTPANSLFDSGKSGKLFVKKYTVTPAKWFGLDTSNVEVETVPLVLGKRITAKLTRVN